MFDKKSEPRWTMGGRADNTVSGNKIGAGAGASPGSYQIPSKIIEFPGMTFGKCI